ncbi:transposase IS5 family protein [Fischerella sp. NIES-4106]|nr:transposase IS5 family protein [Fischerella sp. NIES-4106]
MEDHLLIALEYWREYRTYFHISKSWGIHESTVCRIVRKVENILIKSGAFRLPGKRELNQRAYEWKVLVVDVTETPVERPKKKQRRYYSGKKKLHTLKAQLVVDQVSGKIICTAYGIGRIHDFRLLKNTKVRFHDSQLCLADKGYQGIAKIHAISCIPAKKPRGANLSPANRQHNRNLAQLRIVGEHINRRLKIFRILKEQYRNRRKRFGLRCNLIAGLLNYELALFS